MSAAALDGFTARHVTTVSRLALYAMAQVLMSATDVTESDSPGADFVIRQVFHP